MYIALREEIREYSKELSCYISVTNNILPKIKKYIKELEMRGIKYYLSIKTKENINNVIYIRMCEQNIKKSGKAILVLDDETLLNNELYNFSMYEAGLIMSENKTLYIVNDMSMEVINKIFINSPIKNSQLSDFEGVFKDIDKILTLPKNLFNDINLNQYASKRIFYIKLLTMLDIRFVTLKQIYERLSLNEPKMTMDKALDQLEKNVSFGVKLMHFGKLQLFSRGDFWPYFEEMKDLLIDFPVKTVINKIKILKKDFGVQNDDKDVVATIKMEFIIPNNEILGATFKPFFQIEDTSITKKDIKSLLKSDGIIEDYIFETKENGKTRIYYLSNVDEGRLENELKEELELKYGKKSNYIFPK